MATLTVATIVPTGLNSISPVYAAAAGGGDEFANDGKTFLHVKNGSGSPITVTFVSTGTYKGLALADPAVVVAAGGEQMVGPFDVQAFNNANGRVAMTYSGVVTLTVKAFKLGA